MKTMEELILEFMLALVGNDAICLGAEDDPKWVADYARKLANAYIGQVS